MKLSFWKNNSINRYEAAWITFKVSLSRSTQKDIPIKELYDTLFLIEMDFKIGAIGALLNSSGSPESMSNFRQEIVDTETNIDRLEKPDEINNERD